MAVDMFLRIDGIDGKSQDHNHKKQIDVLAWSWGLSQSGSAQFGGGGGAGKASFQDLSITKWVDRATVDLVRLLLTGKHVATATLYVRKAGNAFHGLEYIEFDMGTVMVTSWSSGGSGGEDRLTENISLAFAEFTFTYRRIRETGARTEEQPVGWDIPRNVERGWVPPPPPPPPPPPVEEEDSAVDPPPVDDGPCGPGNEMVYYPEGGQDCWPIGEYTGPRRDPSQDV